MFDFWMTFGTLVADARLAGTVLSTAPQFKRIGLTFKWADESSSNSSTSAGEYDETSSVAMRNALNGFFRTNYPSFETPISLFCGAKLCRLVCTPQPDGRSFMDVIATLAASFQLLDTQFQPNISRGFLAMLGLSLFDDGVRTRIQNNNLADLSSALYFTPDQNQLKVLQGLVNPLLSVGALPAADPASNPTWDHGCPEVFDFYPGFARAIG